MLGWMAERVALGLRVKTGWAATVVLRQGTGTVPGLVDRRRLDLVDPKVPSSSQPYHAGLELKGKRAEVVVKRGCDAARAAAHKALSALIAEVKPVAIGIVVASDPDLAKIGNDHVRAHAAEGLLFREALEESAERCGVESLTLIEPELWGQAEVALGVPESELKQTVTALGKAVGSPWTALEKNATIAGWLALTG
jgi:LmbE family N-acetylglucosaminyl deacetylase